jgi:hypothetical protein
MKTPRYRRDQRLPGPLIGAIGRAILSVVLVLLLAAWIPGQTQAQSVPSGGAAQAITFPNSGNPEAQSSFQGGVRALHSFWYDEAREKFLDAQRLDPAFGLAYWGEAMSYDNALLSEPGYENEDLGASVLERIEALDAAGRLKFDLRERGFIDAIHVRFSPSLDRDTRRLEYANAMQALVQEFPDDVELILFESLALMATPRFDRNQPEHVTTIAARLEPVFESNPRHPGVLHYLIHVYDTPAFAALAMRQAELYADIAPASSHALHMPSHIYRHLGMWEKVAASNRDAYAASVAWQETSGRPLYMRDYHALEWLFDALLELDQFDAARELISELERTSALIVERREPQGEVPDLLRSLRGYLARATDD